MTCSDTVAVGPRRGLMVLVAAMACLCGCFRPPLTVPVKGVVLLDGKPLGGGVVRFQPAVGQAASGEIAADGTFTLSRHHANDGVPPGTYRVAVIAYDPRAEVEAEENLLVPVKYTRFGSSGIEFTVFPGTLDPVVVQLSSDVAAQPPRPWTEPETSGGDATAETTPSTGDDRVAPDEAARGGA